jgi:6-phosphogluconolactonase (cycloisomerase 2 family)
METNERMSKRFWLLGLAGLISAGLLVACGSNYNSSSNGLVLVGSQGSSVIQTFSFNLNNGHVASVANSTNDTGSKTCLLNGLPSSMVVDPAGQYAYVIIDPSSLCQNSQLGIATFQIKSDGTIAQTGTLITLASPSIIITGAPPPDNTQTAAVNPSTLSMDAAGKFLFVANRATTLVTPDSVTHSVPGSVSVLAIGSGGSLTEVAGSPFFVTTPASTVGQVTDDFVSVAATPTVFPGIGINGTQNSVCSVPSNPPPTTEFLYAVDTVGYQLFEFQVDTSSGALRVPDNLMAIPSFPTDAVPVGIAVDPCNRFLYVSGSLHNRINAYTTCTTVIANGICPFANGHLNDVSGSPFAVSGSANGLGPLVVDPYGNNVYVLGTLSNTLSGFKISPVSGSLTALTPATVATGANPKSIAIRGDDNWMFVTNYQSASVSQYSITPATGALSVSSTITTDNYPFGVAVK